MPVAAKLSRKFYETFGDDVVSEMLDLLNNMDSTYRGELREQNEINFARFDAGVGERLAELKGELRGEISALGTELRAEMAAQGVSLREGLTRQTRWLVGLWAVQMTAFVGTVLAVLQAR